jgi:hypothetical protein
MSSFPMVRRETKAARQSGQMTSREAAERATATA